MTTFELPNTSRLLVRARLVPLQGSRFQPTGFPDLGAARYKLHDGTQMLLVESAQSVANRMESVCWDLETRDIIAALRGVPYVAVSKDGEPLTNSLLEAHRLNSAYIKNSDFFSLFVQELGYDKNKPVEHDRLHRTVCKYDPCALLHGLFLTIPGTSGLRIPRALSGFIEARNVSEVASGGVKNDHVRASKGTEDEEDTRTASEGYGNVPFHRIEFTAQDIDAYFNIDLTQLRSYRLPSATTRLLYAVAVYKVQAFLDRGLRLRTACDLRVESVDVTKPVGYDLPSEGDTVAAIAELIAAATKEGVFASPPVTNAEFSPKKKGGEAGDGEHADEEVGEPRKKGGKKSGGKKGGKG